MTARRAAGPRSPTVRTRAVGDPAHAGTRSSPASARGAAAAPESANASPELTRARELLADGTWHDYETVMRELARLITPGRAGRAAEQARLQHLKRRARQTGQPYVPLPRLLPADPDRVRESGARLIVRKMLSTADFEIGWSGKPPRRRIRYPRTAASRTRRL